MSLMPSKQLFARMGECNNCGWCCQFEGIHRNVVSPPLGQSKLHPDDRRFYELRGGKSMDEGKTIRYLVMAYAPCSAHDTSNCRCKIYDDRPLSCREFPQIPSQIEGTPCSFWFEFVDEQGELNRRGGDGSPYPTSPVFKDK